MFANKLHANAYELILKRDYSGALTLLSQAIAEGIIHPDLYQDRAFCYLHLQQKEDCLSDLDKAISLQANYSYRYSCRAFAKQLFGDVVGAKVDYEQALKLDPTDKIALTNKSFERITSETPLMNPEQIRAQILKTFIEFQKQFPSIEDQKKFLHFLKNGAKNK